MRASPRRGGMPTYQYLCRRCGKSIPYGDNGLTPRRLAIYCPKCAEIIAERMANRYRIAPPVRTVRIKNGKGWIEYRGQFPAALFTGREIITDELRR